MLARVWSSLLKVKTEELGVPGQQFISIICCSASIRNYLQLTRIGFLSTLLLAISENK